MSNWEIMVDYCKDAIIPYSEYLWIALIIGLGVLAMYKARKMVSEL